MFYEVLYFDESDESTDEATDSFLIFEVTDDKKSMRRLVNGEPWGVIKITGDWSDYSATGMEHVISEEEYFLLLL